MRITNVRRGRIIRVTLISTFVLVLVYGLHSYSQGNLGSDTNEVILSDDQPKYYKFHRDVYPVLKTGTLFYDFISYISFTFH